jgi:prolyl-tRNA editing enzyme YbaK/EbsC (Cys-tRNA(Pro) deacylase)
MNNALPASALRVQQALLERGAPFQVRIMPATTRTAQDAAAASGCTVAQIAKSIMFRTERSGRPVLVIASGVNRVNEKSIAAFVGESIEKASPEFVREATGFAIGGVPPVGFPQGIETWIDKSLLGHTEVWAAAGMDHAVFSLNPRALSELTGGTVIDII